MSKPRICAVVTNGDTDPLKDMAPLVDLYEVRIDLIGSGWRGVVENLKKPWIACNRIGREGGGWRGDEAQRIEELLDAINLGAEIVDIELQTENLSDVVKAIKSRAKCLVSYHDLNGTPPLARLKEIVHMQVAAGADIGKVVTTAQNFADNLSVLQLILEFPGQNIVSFAMGESGMTSRILSPLLGGYFTYASLEAGKESAAGQMTVAQLREIYRMLEDGK